MSVEFANSLIPFMTGSSKEAVTLFNERIYEHISNKY